MQTPAPSNSRKRRHFDQRPSELEGEVCQSVSKKRKTVHTPETQQSAAHNSSQIPLERQALRELQRTITQAARASRPNQRIRRPATRLAVAEAKKRHPPLKPAHIFLEDCDREQYKALKNFAKGGGPDLRNLRGVWISNASWMLMLTMLLVPESGLSLDEFQPSQFYKQVARSPL